MGHVSEVGAVTDTTQETMKQSALRNLAYKLGQTLNGPETNLVEVKVLENDKEYTLYDDLFVNIKVKMGYGLTIPSDSPMKISVNGSDTDLTADLESALVNSKMSVDVNTLVSQSISSGALTVRTTLLD